MTFLSYFAPKLLHPPIQASDQAIGQIGDGKGPAILVIPRSKTRFQRLSLPRGDQKARQAAKLQARQTTNFTNLRMRLLPDRDNKNSVCAWIWNGDVDAICQDYIIKPPSIPESLIYEPLHSGTRLIICLEGYEGQFFESGNLIASRWWQHIPTQQEWIIFIRSAKRSVTANTAVVPSPVTPPLKSPYTLLNLDTESIIHMINPARVGLIAAALLCCCLAFQGTRLVTYNLKTEAYTKDYENFRTVNDEAIRERQSALLASRAFRELADRIPDTDVGKALSVILNEIPATTAKLNRLNVSSETIQFIFITSEEFNTVDLINKLEAYPFLSEVFVSKTARGNGYSVRAKLNSFLISGQ